MQGGKRAHLLFFRHHRCWAKRFSLTIWMIAVLKFTFWLIPVCDADHSLAQREDFHSFAYNENESRESDPPRRVEGPVGLPVSMRELEREEDAKRQASRHLFERKVNRLDKSVNLAAGVSHSGDNTHNADEGSAFSLEQFDASIFLLAKEAEEDHGYCAFNATPEHSFPPLACDPDQCPSFKVCILF